jgi:hypothetical protein
MEAVKDDNQVVRGSTSDYSSQASAESKRTIWPVNVLGLKGGEIAHLIPSSADRADSWWFVTQWLFGWDSNTPWSHRERAIHGCHSFSNARQISHTGLKHMACNKIKLQGQGEYFDQNPCILIVPIMTSNEASDWNGGGYDAILIYDTWEGITLSQIVHGVALTLQIDLIATHEEIEKARLLLQCLLQEMGHSRMHTPRDVPPQSLTASEILSGNQMTVPRAVSGRHVVRKVKFDNTNDGNSHRPPDPLLLAAKAAVNWSVRHHQRLAASGEEDDNWSERDYIAAEAFLQEREARLRPQSWEDLARGLGQPNGFR